MKLTNIMHNEKGNLIIYVSSRNNYDMLEGEVLKNINREGFEFINIDDGSCDEELYKGKSICKKYGIVFLENKSRGVQMATQTLVDFINHNRPNCKWVICFQHDNYPISNNFFLSLNTKISSGFLDNFGICGFNVLDRGGYTKDSLSNFRNGGKPLGMIGMAHLSVLNNRSRWLCPDRQSNLLKKDFWNNPFIVEFPMWAAVGININLWNQHVEPTTEYHFHLWLPDIAMQFNINNLPSIILPDLYCLNDQVLKSKYDIPVNSAHGAKAGNEHHFGDFSNFKAWSSRWGWDYENVKSTFDESSPRYRNTLILDYYNHDINTGPLKSF